MFYAIYTGCNRTIPFICAIGDNLKGINNIIAKRLDMQIDELKVYKDDEVETDIPYEVSDISADHIVSYELTVDQFTKLMKDNSTLCICDCGRNSIISIFESGVHSIDMMKVFGKIQVL
jgi:hypothetical protein